MTVPIQGSLRAALISPDPSFRTLVTRCLEELGPSVDWVLRAESDVVELRPESVDRLAERAPDLLFLDVGTSPSAGERFVAAITALMPGLTVVAAGGGLGVDELLALIRAGATGYLRRPWSEDELRDVCANALRKLLSTRADSAVEDPASNARVIALFSPKGGTGVTTLATNLAVHIRQATTKKTLLLDLSPELGTCPVLLGAEPRYSYLDVLESLQRMDERLLQSFLEEHESGLRVLASPQTASMAGEVRRDSVVAIVRLLRRFFDYVVVDLGRSVVDETVATVLELADERLLVTAPELPTLRNVKQILPLVPHGGDAKESIRVVVSRYEDGVSVSTKEIERAVGLPVWETVHEDRERVGRSANLGRPIVMQGSSPYAKTVGRIGAVVAAADVTKNGRGGTLSGLLRTVLLPLGLANGGGGHAREKAAAAEASSTHGNGRRPSAGRKPEREPTRLAVPRTIERGAS
jgi:pilus assembly protein CpaE